MSAVDLNGPDGASELRERVRAKCDVDAVKRDASALNKAEESKGEKEKKTFGRTPDGTIFTVPHTHDMVSQLLSPSQPKNLSDLFVLLVLAVQIAFAYLLPASVRIPILAIIFLFWRAGYNVGIGYLLQIQSHHKRLVSWARKLRIFENPSSGKNPHPKVYALLKREMETKIPEDYKFEEAPIEYNTWLVFRRVVDLILMCDFVSYCLFAIACAGRPVGENFIVTIGRWAAGIVLFIFNVWVKLDAHRVVKDYAWYWGDFFYLIDQELTFDGVFEMAPHPMYSVGYAGYYGISLMTASYKVLFISIIAHAAQFAFLVWVENPHIEKTYNSPPRARRPTGESQMLEISLSDTASTSSTTTGSSTVSPAAVHNLLGLQNIDLHRVTDVSVLLFQLYLFTFAALTPSNGLWQTIFVVNAFVWRFWYAFGIGFILNSQSNEKSWSRHFIKYGDSTGEAWRQWKGVYHLSMTMCYASFLCAAWKMYTLPEDFTYGMSLLRHVLGAGLVALHLWISVSVYESLGEFGWFYGDFFFDQAPKLTYSGIYRFLNNPERVLGLAGVWGIALITWSKAIFVLAFLSHTLTLMFIQLVERPHMQKLYGQSLRQDSGISKTLKRSLPDPIRRFQGSVDKALGESLEFVEEFLESARPKLAAGMGTFVRDTTKLFKNYPARVSITRLTPDLAGVNPEDYSIEMEGARSALAVEIEKRSGREGENARAPQIRTSDFRPITFEYGAPLKVRWKAPINHDKKDWIGLYMVSDNASRDVTRVSSQGRWAAVTPEHYDNLNADKGILVSDKLIVSTTADGEQECLTGEIEFTGDKLWWTTGVFEFRYHHAGAHNVMAISLPFEVRIPRFDEDDVEIDSNGLIQGAIEQALLPVVRNCFDLDPDIAPRTVEEPFGNFIERDGKFARRVVFAVHQMFGIEFAPEVVQADGTVKNLAWRICNAKKVLAPYSMSPSKGNTTPSSPKY